MTVLIAIFFIASIIGNLLLIFWNIKLDRDAETVAERAAEKAKIPLIKEVEEWRQKFMKSESIRTGLTADFNAKQEKWRGYCSALKTENERLMKYRGIDDVVQFTDRLKAEAEQKNREADEKLRGLAPYYPILDAVQKAKDIISSANSNSQDILEFARNERQRAESQARITIENANSKARQMIDNATTQATITINNANIQASNIVSDAQTQATTILAPVQNELMEKTVFLRSLENSIKGYGNEYLIPNDSLFDDLADDYSFTKAGADLKSARERSRLMIEDGSAAVCDYAEPSRREMAIRFVLDAFNGKVDSIQAQAKTDNFGKLRQKIYDAFAMVNEHGKAFRNARITESYREARIDELRLAVIINEYKKQEREEQREAREQAREEEKVRREHERAIKQAEREEKLVQKALEEAQKRFNEASVEYKEKYRAQLEELQGKLLDAEAKSQRAISEAQKTKKGHVYIISNVGSFGENVYKIGLTRRKDPSERIHELGDASVPFPFDIHAMIECEDSPALETALHSHFVLNRMNKVNPRKEFFRLSIASIKDEIEGIKDNFGIANIKWTERSVAQEYFESIKRDKDIENDPKLRELWERRQIRNIENDSDQEEDDE